jgi:hypothetical protein
MRFVCHISIVKRISNLNIFIYTLYPVFTYFIYEAIFLFHRKCWWEMNTSNFGMESLAVPPHHHLEDLMLVCLRIELFRTGTSSSHFK